MVIHPYVLRVVASRELRGGFPPIRVAIKVYGIWWRLDRSVSDRMPPLLFYGWLVANLFRKTPASNRLMTILVLAAVG